MKSKKTVFLVLTVVSFIVLCFYIINTITIFSNNDSNLVININSIFGNIIVCSIFLSNYFFISNVSKTTPKKEIAITTKYFPLLLLLIAVLGLSIYNYLLIENGFSQGKELYWQLTTLVFGIASCVFLVYLMKKFKTIMNNNYKKPAL